MWWSRVIACLVLNPAQNGVNGRLHIMAASPQWKSLVVCYCIADYRIFRFQFDMSLIMSGLRVAYAVCGNNQQLNSVTFCGVYQDAF